MTRLDPDAFQKGRSRLARPPPALIYLLKGRIRSKNRPLPLNRVEWGFFPTIAALIGSLYLYSRIDSLSISVLRYFFDLCK